MAKPSPCSKAFGSGQKCPLRSPNPGQQKSQSGTCNKTRQYGTATKQEEDISTPSNASLREKLFRAYEEVYGRNPVWRRPEDEKLANLLARYSASEILDAWRSFLADGCEFLQKRRHPFSIFASQVEQYVGAHWDPDDDGHDVTVEDIRA